MHTRIACADNSVTTMSCSTVQNIVAYEWLPVFLNGVTNQSQPALPVYPGRWDSLFAVSSGHTEACSSNSSCDQFVCVCACVRVCAQVQPVHYCADTRSVVVAISDESCSPYLIVCVK